MILNHWSIFITEIYRLDQPRQPHQDIAQQRPELTPKEPLAGRRVGAKTTWWILGLWGLISVDICWHLLIVELWLIPVLQHLTITVTTTVTTGCEPGWWILMQLGYLENVIGKELGGTCFFISLPQARRSCEKPCKTITYGWLTLSILTDDSWLSLSCKSQLCWGVAVPESSLVAPFKSPKVENMTSIASATKATDPCC